MTLLSLYHPPPAQPAPAPSPTGRPAAPRHRVRAAPTPPPPPAPLPPDEVAHQKLARAIDKLSKGLTVIQQHHLLALLAADVVHRSALLDAHIPLDERYKQSAREYRAWAETVDRPPVKYPAAGA